MTSQLPLINSAGNIPGPVFEPRPGWGGRLRKWWQDNAYLAIFRLILLSATILIIISLVRQPSRQPPSQAATVTPSPLISLVYSQTALSGEGLSHIVSRILDDYLKANLLNFPLDQAEHIFCVNYLTNQVLAEKVIKPGQVYSLSEVQIKGCLVQASQLTPTQRQAWLKLIWRQR